MAQEVKRGVVRNCRRVSCTVSGMTPPRIEVFTLDNDTIVQVTADRVLREWEIRNLLGPLQAEHGPLHLAAVEQLEAGEVLVFEKAEGN